MKTILTAAALSLVAASASAAATPVGLWHTPTNNGEVLITACDQGLCGKIVTSDRIKLDPNLPDGRNRNEALRGRVLKDLQILSGFKGGPTEWKGGTVYNPDDGGTYKGTIRVVDDHTLKLTGCIVFPLCKSEIWTRIN
jgi:uncharacterized protein (DUF2147 family)